MRFIDLSRINLNDLRFIRWNKLAQKRHAQLLACQTHDERKKYLEAHPSWRAFKKILTDTFGEMCWYSEKFFKTSPGDVDHFRPKNRSTDENGNVLYQDGYWKLAYDYKNYRYCCENCNRRFEDGGKNDCFPLKTSPSPTSVPSNNDDNVLLDPCNEGDCELISCNEEGAVVAMSSDAYDIHRVQISVDVYNLNLFNSERKKIRNNCSKLLKRFFIHYMDSNRNGMNDDIEDIKELMNLNESFSSFVRKCVLEKINGESYEPMLKQLLNIA